MPDDVGVGALYPVRRAGSGHLALMAAPAGGAALQGDVEALVASGVSDVVCLLPDAELAQLGLSDEPETLRRNGLRLHRLPVPDFGVPAAEPARVLAATVVRRLAEGASVVVHCRGGVGRSSTVAAAVLVAEGIGPDAAWQALAAARGRHVPETYAQRAFVAELAGTPLPPRPLAVRVVTVVVARLLGLVAGTASALSRALRRARPRA
jgi:protein-tyrosine phosphatase